MTHGADSLKHILYALAANFAIFLAKFFGTIFTGSGSMLAEIVHSLVAAGYQELLLLGLRPFIRLSTSNYSVRHHK